MSNMFPPAVVGLDALLTGIGRGLVSAQAELDRAAMTPSADIHIRPVWFVFEKTVVELELTTFFADSSKNGGFQCRLLDPVSVALRGHAASSTTRLRVEIGPLGADLLRTERKE